MGTYQSTVITVRIPGERVAGLAADLREHINANRHRHNDWYGSDWSDERLVGRWLIESEGTEYESEDDYTVEDDGSIVISNGFYGKLAVDYAEIENLYGTNGAVGTIDAACDDEFIRVRLTRDGRVLRSAGVVVYPGDEPEAE